MPHSQSVRSPIGKRLIIYIVLFSSLITLFITAIQLYRDYNIDIEHIHTELKQIENVHLDSLTSALWTSNTKLLQTSIEGILKIQDIQFIEIRDKKKVWAKAGEIKGENNIQRNYPMLYHHRNKDINIGSLTVNVSLDGVYQRLFDKVWVILISNGIKTAFVAIFIYFLFYRMVTRHLSAISAFSEKHDPLSNNTPLSLDRDHVIHDEFDAVVKSINNMHTRLNEQISEINRQKQYLSQTLNSIGDAVVTTDDEGNVTRLNPVAEQLTGWTNEDAYKQSLKTIFPIIDAKTREAIANPVEKVLATGETVYLSNHTTLIAKDNTEYQITDSAAPILDEENRILGMVLIFNDVSEQYQVREALRQSEKKLRLIHSQVPGIVYQFKIDADGNQTLPYVSPSVENHIGLTAEAIMQDPDKWFSLTHPEDIASLEKSTVESLENLSKWEWQGRFIRGDGEIIWLRGTAMPERLEDGSTLWSGMLVDVTERVLAAETIRRSQKMDALGKLTGGVAHDYNNMLGVVLGYSDLLREQLSAQPKLQTYVDKIIHAGERGAKLTKKLLAFSRNTSSDVKKFNINTLLHDEKHMLEKTLTARIRLELELEDDLWPVCLDESELEDAILNMSINAMHAIGENNGQLTITTDNISISAADAEILGLEPGDYALLSISDTGCGIDETDQEKIFDPFYSTKGEQGTGLGLSQVYGFITRCGGTITVDSKLTQGTRFTLYFPRYLGEINDADQVESKNHSTLKGRESILIVDDEPALLELIYEVLSEKNYQVFCAERAEQALEILETEDIDLLITDIIMPDMDGYALAAIVQQKYPDIKIQLASGFSGKDHAGQIGKNIAQNLLQKPYNADTLLRKIRALLH